MKLLTKIFGTRNDKIIKAILPIVDRINSLEPQFKALTDEQLREKTFEFRARAEKGESLDSILPEAYANYREAASRVLGQRHYDVQLIGGVILHRKCIAEMRTGEGKTLTATLPTYLHGLSGKGAHVVTVNDYLASRDAEWMGKIYGALGLSCGTIVQGQSEDERRAAYQCDITYATNNELGFDFLRDNMKTHKNQLVQRALNFAIVDEVDSILIDEARTPLIISGPANTNTQIYVEVNAAIPGLQKDSDYIVDEKSRTVALTEDGITKLEKRLKIPNLYDPQHVEHLHHAQQALKAHILFRKDVDYVVRNGEILIVDEFTGRLMPGRRYSDGLHGALEAKEHVRVQQETQTLATITYQNYFRQYNQLAGMTGTADTEAVEFKNIYELEVVTIPTNRTVVRDDQEDVIYRTSIEKYRAIAEDIQEAQKKGQPVLVGTVSVAKSELLSSMLTKLGVPHEILNAKNHAREAEIIASAGHAGRVTISTNMAGRGTDIKLGEGVREIGGLYVIGTERHESRRIDNQLRGRSGRQGDPGKTKFFLSLEDDLMRIFASDRISWLMERMGMKEGESIVSPMVTRAVGRAQKRVEEQNYASRKHVLEYDDVMSQQRQVVYKKRRQVLHGEFELDFFEETIADILSELVEPCSPAYLNQEKWDWEKLAAAIEGPFKIKVTEFPAEPCQVEGVIDHFVEVLSKAFNQKMSKASKELIQQIESVLFLQIIDMCWKEHLLGMDSLRDSVSLQGYGGKQPLEEYKVQAFSLFSTMMARVFSTTITTLFQIPEPQDPPANDQKVISEGED